MPRRVDVSAAFRCAAGSVGAGGPPSGFLFDKAENTDCVAPNDAEPTPVRVRSGRGLGPVRAPRSPKPLSSNGFSPPVQAVRVNLYLYRGPERGRDTENAIKESTIGSRPDRPDRPR